MNAYWRWDSKTADAYNHVGPKLFLKRRKIRPAAEKKRQTIEFISAEKLHSICFVRAYYSLGLYNSEYTEICRMDVEVEHCRVLKK